MSRIGRLPVAVPNGVQINVQGSDVHVKGPKGELKRTFSPLVGIALENGEVVVTRKSDHPRERALAWHNPGCDREHGAWRQFWF